MAFVRHDFLNLDVEKQIKFLNCTRRKLNAWTIEGDKALLKKVLCENAASRVKHILDESIAREEHRMV